MPLAMTQLEIWGVYMFKKGKKQLIINNVLMAEALENVIKNYWK